MSTRSGGSNCAIATCDLYSGKTKKIGMTDISFHRYLLSFILSMMLKLHNMVINVLYVYIVN